MALQQMKRDAQMRVGRVHVERVLELVADLDQEEQRLQPSARAAVRPVLPVCPAIAFMVLRLRTLFRSSRFDRGVDIVRGWVLASPMASTLRKRPIRMGYRIER